MQSDIQAGIESPIKEKETKYSKSGVKKKAIELYENGKNPTEICKILKEKGLDVTEEGIRQLLLKSSKIQKNVASDIQVAKKFANMAMDYNNELKSIMEEIKEAREIARDTKDLGAWSALLGRAFQGIELFSKIAGDLKESKIDVNIILNQIDERVRANKGLFEESVDIGAIIRDEDEYHIKKREEHKR